MADKMLDLQEGGPDSLRQPGESLMEHAAAKARVECKGTGQHIWRLRDFDYPSGRLVHKCRRCGLEKESQALHAHRGKPELYKRWRA